MTENHEKHAGSSEELEISVKVRQQATGGWEESLHPGPAGWVETRGKGRLAALQ